MNALEINNLNYSYHEITGETPALYDINLTVEKGSFVSIIGPSGCGKSTLLSLIAGIYTPESGTILINQRSDSQRLNDVGYMLQHDHLFEWRTVYGNVTLGLEIRKERDQKPYKYASDLLDQYGLSDFKKAHPSQLSGGMRQRVALIRTLALEPDILLLDEPFSALDYQTRLTVCDDIASIIKKEHKTAIMVTHDLAEAISVADTVYVLSKRPGHIVCRLPIVFKREHQSPMDRRNEPEFNRYFNYLFQDLEKYE